VHGQTGRKAVPEGRAFAHFRQPMLSSVAARPGGFEIQTLGNGGRFDWSDSGKNLRIGAMKTVATFSWLDEAYLTKARLEGNGVRAYIPDELTVSTRPLLGNALGGVRVQVEDEEYERARQILQLPPIAPLPAPDS
jgi:hypothetical protein